MISDSTYRQDFQTAFGYAQSQVETFLEKYPSDYYPMYTLDGEFGHDQKRWTHWCDGFFPGMMFVFAKREKSDKWLHRAVEYSTPLADRQYDRTVHDLGFLFFSTYLRWLGLGGPREEIENLLVQSGKTMAMRFMENGQYLRSFVEPSSLFIDIMMNVGTIFWAGCHTDDQALKDIAEQHCLTSRRVLVRGDGSTAHEAVYDLDTGEALRLSTHQGFRGDSCWSRGLAWSLYGFTRSFKQNGNPQFLETAIANADYYLANTPDDDSPPWDYDAPESGPIARTQVDTSAGAIAASGLFQLAELVPDRTKAATYRAFALSTLHALATKHLGNKRKGTFEGVLDGGVYHIHKKLGVHESVLFGDYFFVEALDRALKTLDKKPLGHLKPYPEDSLPDWARKWSDGPTEENLPAPDEKTAGK